MPEIPDIEVFAVNLKTLFAGKTLSTVVVVNGNKLKDSAEELTKSLEGSVFEDIPVRKGIPVCVL